MSVLDPRVRQLMADTNRLCVQTSRDVRPFGATVPLSYLKREMVQRLTECVRDRIDLVFVDDPLHSPYESETFRLEAYFFTKDELAALLTRAVGR